mmetsp:Transcript_14601/g.29417  ORF Transcript_14601/g.29417 Transcript_14601/m.29417 type:complete len:84 (+) Transcript_14601:654-905(+)
MNQSINVEEQLKETRFAYLLGWTCNPACRHSTFLSLFELNSSLPSSLPSFFYSSSSPPFFRRRAFRSIDRSLDWLAEKGDWGI